METVWIQFKLLKISKFSARICLIMWRVKFLGYEGQIFPLQVLYWRWVAFFLCQVFATVQIAAVKWKDLSSVLRVRNGSQTLNSFMEIHSEWKPLELCSFDRLWEFFEWLAKSIFDVSILFLYIYAGQSQVIYQLSWNKVWWEASVTQGKRLWLTERKQAEQRSKNTKSEQIH